MLPLWEDLFIERTASPGSSNRLVIFPMSGNNTFETSDFADLRFSFWSSEGVSHSPTVFLFKKKILRNMKQMVLCSLSKEFVFSHLLTVEKSKNKIAERRNLLDIKLIFESIVFMKPVSVNINKNCLRPSKIPWTEVNI